MVTLSVAVHGATLALVNSSARYSGANWELESCCEPGLAHQLGGSAAGLVAQEVHLEEAVAGVRVSQHHHRVVIVGREDVRGGVGAGDDPGRSQKSRELNGVGGGCPAVRTHTGEHNEAG